MNMSNNFQVGTGGNWPFYQPALRRFEYWQERWRDSILTALLAMLALEVFVNTLVIGGVIVQQFLKATVS